MLSANGSYVKVYLYLSKCIQAGGSGLSISSLADQMENTEKDIIRALKYWNKIGLINLTFEDNVITTIQMENPDILTYKQKSKEMTSPDDNKIEAVSEAAKPQPETVSEVTKPQIRTVPEPPKLQSEAVSEIAQKETNMLSPKQMERLSENEEFKWLTSIIENYLGKLLTPADIELVAFLYATLNFSSELILYLYDYCISESKTKPSYIKKVALAWDEAGVRTVQDAEAISADYRTVYNTVRRAFGIKRSLAEAEKIFITNWTMTMHFSYEMIMEACNRTILATGEPSFKYANKILCEWQKNNIVTIEDLTSFDKAFLEAKANDAKTKKTAAQNKTVSKNQFTSYPQRGYSKEKSESLEKKLLANILES